MYLSSYHATACAMHDDSTQVQLHANRTTYYADLLESLHSSLLYGNTDVGTAQTLHEMSPLVVRTS